MKYLLKKEQKKVIFYTSILEFQKKILYILKKFYKLNYKKLTQILNLNSLHLSLFFLRSKKKHKLISKARCLITNRGRGLVSKYSLSRLELKRFFNFNFISGMNQKLK